MRKTGEDIPQCPICSGKDIAPVSQHINFIITGIWFCSHCNHWFGYPEPDGIELDRYYKKTYSPRRRSYFGEGYYTLMERRAEAQIRFIQNFLPRLDMPGNFRGWKVIDWGCGIGALVSALQHSGADAVGFDSDLKAIEVGRKRFAANIAASLSYDTSVSQGQFDLLLLSHVVEHLPDMRQTLQNLLKVLKSGGFIFIEVPNCFNEMFLGEMDHESHLHFFSRQSLMQLLKGLGLHVVACVSCGPPNSFVYRQNQILAIPKLATQMVRMIEFISKFIVKKSSGNDQQVRTIYDGFYEHYPPDESGLWLRCLSCI